MSSDAVGVERVSRIVGYKLRKGTFQTSNPNLPQRIVVLGEMNLANQATALTPLQITNQKQAGDAYGYGSPLHMIARILFPVAGDGIGGIPLILMPQIQAVGSAAKVITVTPSGQATNNGTHYVKVAGRNNIDGSVYAINIVKGDTVAIINQKINDAVNAVIASPLGSSNTSYVTTLTTKWRGLTANDITVTIDTGLDTLGITYVVSTVTPGSGTPDISAALNLFGNAWNTIVINSYGLVTTVLDALEAFNGLPDPTNPTGRYGATVFKPFIALSGSVLDDPSSITDTRNLQLTVAVCPAPLSAGAPFEAAANMAYLFALQAQNNPHLDVSSASYPDMPTPDSIGSMANYNSRDAIVKKGCSTVDLISGRYQVQDFVTTYHPAGENPPQYRYCRNINIDWNVRYGYFLLEQINVIDHAIAKDSDIVSVSGIIKPKAWIQILNSYADDLVSRLLITDSTFMDKSIVVNISPTNPDRLETYFKYKRSGYTRIASTTAEAGFNFGTV